MKIAPSILSSDFVRLEEEIKKIEKNGADIIHLDVMDGHFVPNLTFGIPVIKQIRKITSLPLDVHLMVKNPDNYVNDLAQIGVEYVSVHQEASAHLHRLIMEIKSKKIKAGVALNPSTPVEMVFPIIKDLDFVLLMSVNPGFSGQKFIESSVEKIKALSKMLKENKSNAIIQVDGGINKDTIKKVARAGATSFVAGSAIFNTKNYKQAILSLRQNI